MINDILTNYANVFILYIVNDWPNINFGPHSFYVGQKNHDQESYQILLVQPGVPENII